MSGWRPNPSPEVRRPVAHLQGGAHLGGKPPVRAAEADGYHLSDAAFVLFRDMIFEVAGISMSPAKKALVAGRLGKRLRHYGLASFESYFRLIQREENKAELQVAVDLLTTNETYFFREEKHFALLREQVLAGATKGRSFRVWSAASSSGEEAYSVAMVLADRLGEAPWEVVASDISTRVLEKARTGLYPLSRAKDIPEAYLKCYCLKGTGQYEGMLLVERALRERVQFMQVNLNQSLPNLGDFDVIFLRNVMIYFNQETKRQVVARLVSRLRPGGYLLIGHSESLHGIAPGSLVPVSPSVYRLAPHG